MKKISLPGCSVVYSEIVSNVLWTGKTIVPFGQVMLIL